MQLSELLRLFYFRIDSCAHQCIVTHVGLYNNTQLYRKRGLYQLVVLAFQANPPPPMFQKVRLSRSLKRKGTFSVLRFKP